MPKPSSKERRVLALDPTSKGFGFVVFEGPKRLIDWGVALRRRKDSESLGRVMKLLDRYEPDTIVLEDFSVAAPRRAETIRRLLWDAVRAVADRKVRIRTYPRQAILRHFALSGARTKHEIAVAISQMFAELAPKLPPKRKPWMSEDERMSIFDAAAAGLFFFAFR